MRAPRLRVLANGAALAGVVSARIISTNHFGADRFTVEVATLPAASWAAQSDILCDVQASLDGGQSFISLIQGAVDRLDIDALRNLVRIDGRDLSAPLIETRTQETFANRTSSEIATLLAQRHGLEPQVQQTATPVGRYYQAEHDRITLDQFSRATTEWDLLTFLAQEEGFDLFVQGQALFFQPAAPDRAPIPFSIADAVDISLERALTLARDIEVTVKSWNSRQQNAFTQTARSQSRGNGGGGSGSTGRRQQYVIVRPNLTSDQALKLAQQTLADLSRHERVIAITMPGELTLTPRDRIALFGTGTDFDQTYFVDRIERSLRFEGGFVQHVRAKNVSPASAATTPADIVATTTN